MSEIDDGRKAAMIFAGYHWTRSLSTGVEMFYCGGDGRSVGHVSRDERGWYCYDVFHASSATDGGYSSRKLAMRAMERAIAARVL
jgi:hypothetical protein